MTKTNTQPYSLGEEILNSLSHGIGAVFGVVALTLMVTLAAQQGDPWRIVSFSIYGASIFILFLSSTLYHAFQNPKVKQVFKTIDHCAIYLLIAGTYTPFLLVSMRGTTGWVLFGIIWSLAILGIVFKVCFAGRFKWLSLSTYIGMGWLIIFAADEMSARLSDGAITWLAAGGVTYTLGTVFYAIKRIPFNHAIWHMFVLGGCVCHFISVFGYVLPAQS